MGSSIHLTTKLRSPIVKQFVLTDFGADCAWPDNDLHYIISFFLLWVDMLLGNQTYIFIRGRIGWGKTWTRSKFPHICDTLFYQTKTSHSIDDSVKKLDTFILVITITRLSYYVTWLLSYGKKSTIFFQLYSYDNNVGSNIIVLRFYHSLELVVTGQSYKFFPRLVFLSCCVIFLSVKEVFII